LQQEGWHYELETIDDLLTFKGVVFNEMKGAYSSPDNLLYRQSRRALFPDNAYGLDSGGDPAEIPNLTYEQFKAFHETYYHPSNARLFFYGDDDPEQRLRFLNTWLSEFDRIEVDSSIPLQPRFESPRHETIPYDAGEAGEDGPDAKRGMLTVNWLLAQAGDPELSMGLGILEHILIGTPASPLRKALIDSGLGEDLTGGGLNDGLHQMTFSTGLKGIAVDDAAKVETLIAETLAGLAAEGIDPAMTEASLNTVEFSMRESNFGGMPRGLVWVLYFAMNAWLHDRDPLAFLAFEGPLQAIKERLAAGERYFESLIQDYLIDNTHRATVLLKPDPNVRKGQEAAERARLDAARAAMSEDELRQIVQATHELKRLQNAPDDPEALAAIPTLTLADLDKEGKPIPLQVIDSDRYTTLYHDLFTNGIVYLDLAFDLHTLPQGLLPYVSLFGGALTKIGTESEDFVKLSQRIGRKTGGIWALTLTSATVGSPRAAARLVLRGKATLAQADDLTEILHDILLTVKLDNQERFRQMVLEAKARAEARLVPRGHGAALTRLGAQFGEAGWLAEQLGGIEQIYFLRRLADQVESDWPAVLSRLEEIRHTLISASGLVCNITLDGDNWTSFQPKLARLISTLPALPQKAASWVPQSGAAFEGLTIPARVNYVAKGANLYEQGYNLHGSMSVISNYLRTGYLWERIRVQGGAYGAYFTFDRHSGLLAYLSYRDPNLLGTLDNYDGLAQFVRDLDLSEDELVKSIIGAIGRIDAYQLPDAKGYTSMVRYLIGESDEDRQRLREQVLGTTAADLSALADVLQRVSEQGHVVVLGSQEALDEANAERGGWLEITKVL
jgi:Zn-dependent M16 (insulinase) family peptidase